MVLMPLLSRRSEERFSRNAETDLVCRLLLEKKKTKKRTKKATPFSQYIYKLTLQDNTPHSSTHTRTSEQSRAHITYLRYNHYLPITIILSFLLYYSSLFSFFFFFF